MTIYKVYKITNRLNGKIYIGQTKQTIEKRFVQHSKTDSPLGKAMRQCGIENFTIEVIEYCENQEHLNEQERFWIKTLNCKVPNGYNLADGGNGYARIVKNQLPNVSHCKSSKKFTVGESLKRFRKEFGLTQKEIAEVLEINQPMYQYNESNGALSANFVKRIAEHFNVSADYLLGLSDKPRPDIYNEEEIKSAFALRDALKSVLRDSFSN